MSRYIGTTQLRQYLSPQAQLPTTEDALLQACIDRAESAIDNYTRRNFAGSAGTVRYNRYSMHLTTDQALYLNEDLHTLVSITNGDSQVIPVGSVWLEPRNAGPPYRIVRLMSGYVYTWNTDSDVILAGTWGFSTVAPAAIQQAAVRWAAYLYRQKDVGPNDVSGFTEAGEVVYPKGMPDDIKQQLAPYRSRSGGVV